MDENFNKLTNYDIIEILKKNIHDDILRNTFEGAAIIITPLLLDPLPRSNYEYYTDPLYKLKISEAIKNYLYNNSKKKKEELSELIDYNIRVVDSLPLITERIKNAHESLYLVSLKAVNRLDGISQKKEFCINFGEQIEKRFKKFYNNKGYTTDPEKPRNIRKYLRSEFEFFTRILNELYQKLD